MVLKRQLLYVEWQVVVVVVSDARAMLTFYLQQ